MAETMKFFSNLLVNIFVFKSDFLGNSDGPSAPSVTNFG